MYFFNACDMMTYDFTISLPIVPGLWTHIGTVNIYCGFPQFVTILAFVKLKLKIRQKNLASIAHKEQLNMNVFCMFIVSS